MKKLLLIAAALTLAACNPAKKPEAAAGPKTSGVNLTYVDKAVAPGDDFDAYANGAWRAATEIPADRSSTGISYEVFQKAEKRTDDMIKSFGEKKPAITTDEGKIGAYYAAFLDTATIEGKGLASAKPYLDKIAAIADRKALSSAIGATVRADTDPLNATNYWTQNLFGAFITQAPDDPATTIPYLLQGGMGLPERDYFLSADPEMVKIREAYRVYIGDLLRLAGVPDAKAKADRIYALETKIARAQASILDTQDIHQAKPWGQGEFAAKAPGIDWAAFFVASGLGDQTTFIVWQPAATTRLSALVASEPLEVWKDWLAFHLINDKTAVLPKALDQRSFDFYGKTLSGAQVQRDRTRRAIAAVSNDLGDAVGKAYAERYFPAAAKADITNVVSNIIKAFDARVAALDWMTPATKAEARKKISTIYVGVGYPDSWPRNFASLDVKPDDAFGNAMRASAFEYRHQLSKLGKPGDKREWWMTPQTVNALNIPLQNALNFPAAILEAPYYDPGGDDAAKYGAIGAVIGHEIVHSFDNLGADFDSTGRLRNWWTPQDSARFEASGKALAAQYSQYESLPGLKLNGDLVLGENIADLAGLAAALDAYHASLGGKAAPVIDGLSGDQRFFLAYAQAWRDKTRDAAMRQQVATGVHAPDALRVQTVRNLDAWYAAFGVKPGQKLYLDEKSRVRVW